MRAIRKVQVDERSPPYVVSFAGEYALERRAELLEQLLQLEARPSVAMDFTETLFIDASCIGKFMKLHRVRLDKGFRCVTVLARRFGIVRRIIDIVDFGTNFRIVEMPDSAVWAG